MIIKIRIIIYSFLLLIPFIAFAQKEPRKVLYGQVVSDSLVVENITVHNKTSNIRAVTDDAGEFSIYARKGDTLYFSALAFRDARLVLKEEHLKEKKLIVKLEVDVTVMDEMIITTLTGNLATDSKRAKIKNFEGYDSSALLDPNDIRNYQWKEPNNALPQTESNLTGIDFKRLYKLFIKKKKKGPKGEEYVAREPFNVEIKKRFTHYFFTETLKIPHEEISEFIDFCDNGPVSMALLHPDKEFELIDYLVKKSAEYLEEK